MQLSEISPRDLGRVTIPGRGSFDIGAVYARSSVHQLLRGGNSQSGISTVLGTEAVVLFTGIEGQKNGYFDWWDEYGNFHYSGEGQKGDMQLNRGNKALLNHAKQQKRLLLFQMLGKGRPVRFHGEFQYVRHYQTDSPGRDGVMRKAFMFVLGPILDSAFTALEAVPTNLSMPFLPGSTETTRMQLQEVRTKQSVFRRRLTTIEAGCRLTSISDLRFLRASHMKPWAAANDSERVCRENGLLLTPSADLLFDRGWISFRDNGELLVASGLPDKVTNQIGLDLRPGRNCGSFTRQQASFIEYHRDCIYEQGNVPGGRLEF